MLQITEETFAAYDYQEFAGKFDHDKGPDSLQVLSPEARITSRELDTLLQQRSNNQADFVLLDTRPSHQVRS